MCKKNKNWFKTFSVALAFSLPLSNSAYADVYTFSEDFTDTAAGTVIGDAYVSSGALTLTDNLRETGAYVLPYSGDSALNISSLGFSVTFDYDITNGTTPYYADGFSFNIGNYDMDYISRLGTAPPVEGDPIVPVGEMGIYESDYSDSMLSVAFDTYGTDSGVRVLYNGVSIAISC